MAERSGLTKKAANDAVEAVLEPITNALANDEKVTLVGFGTFEVRERAARKASRTNCRRRTAVLCEPHGKICSGSKCDSGR